MNYTIKLQELRDSHSLTQYDVAEQLKISRSTYKDYELQTTIIPIKHLISLSDFYHVSIDYLLGFNDTLNYANSKNFIDKSISGERLKQFRKENHLTQVKLATILNTTFSTIAFYEKGRNFISTSFLYMICKKYYVSADYLLGRIDEPKYLK